MPLILYVLDAAARKFRSPGGPDLDPATPFGDLGYGQAPYGLAPYGSPE